MAKCARKWCLACARYFPVVLVYADRAKYPNGAAARLVCGVGFCGSCKDGVTIAELMPDASWGRVVMLFARTNRVTVKREEAQLEFIRTNSEEAIAFLQARADAGDQSGAKAQGEEPTPGQR